jgi:DNA invertase Pin-like site-specific DNA recombinase
VFTKKQADAGNLERQMERLRAYAREKGYRVVAEYSDVASGSTRTVGAWNGC